MSAERADGPREIIPEREIASLAQNLATIRHQLDTGRIDRNLLSRQLDAFSDVLARIRLEQKQQAKSGRFEALYNVSRLLGSSLDLQTVLDQVMDAVVRLTGAERGFLMLLDDDGGLSIQAARNFDQRTLSSEALHYSRMITRAVLDEGRPVLTTNAAEDPRFAGTDRVVVASLPSIMAAPLRARGNVIGLAYVENRAVSGLFKREDLDALEALAGQAAVALDNALLFRSTDQELTARIEQLQQLRRIDLQLNQTLDQDTAIRYTLEWACRLTDARGGYFGLVDEDSTGVRIVDHYGEIDTQPPPEYLDDIYPEVSYAASKGETMTFTPVGSNRTLIVPVRRDKKVIGVVAIERRDKALFSIEQQDLVERIAARAATAIENARLYAVVQAADKAKSEFVGIVAHDLKVPMTSILGYADLTKMAGDLNERQQEFVATIRNTVRRMETLVSDLADISRIESGHFFMEKTRVAVADVIRAVKDGTQTEIERRGHTWVEEVEPELPVMWVDFYRLVQVLTNFVSNAYKYTPDGGVITLRARRVAGRIQFSVSDTGIGLSEEARARLGEKFWRAEDEFTRSQPGSGLGFAITRHLVEQMGGSIQIESEAGRGSTFTFTVVTADD